MAGTASRVASTTSGRSELVCSTPMLGGTRAAQSGPAFLGFGVQRR